MRIAFTSDWHVDASTAGVERIAEIRSHVDHLALACRSMGIDLVCFLGDAYDPGTLHDPRWASFLAESAYKLSQAAPFGVLMIPGNHDTIDVSEPLSTLSPIAVFSTLVRVRMGQAQALRVSELPELHTFRAPDSPSGMASLAVLALPYVSRAVERTHEFARAFENAVDLARLASSSGVPLVVIGHYSIAGIHPGSEGEMMRGRELPIPAAVLRDLAPTLVVNGHYHERQTVRVDGLTVEIVGAPARFTFGEADADRGFLLAEV